MELRSGNAIRIARHRERRRYGRIMLTIEADEITLVDTLVANELLPVTLMEDKGAIAEALTKMLQIILEDNKL